MKQLIIYEDTKGIYQSMDKLILNSNEQESTIRLYKTAVKALKQANMKPSKQVRINLHQQRHSLEKNV